MILRSQLRIYLNNKAVISVWLVVQFKTISLDKTSDGMMIFKNKVKSLLHLTPYNFDALPFTTTGTPSTADSGLPDLYLAAEASACFRIDSIDKSRNGLISR